VQEAIGSRAHLLREVEDLGEDAGALPSLLAQLVDAAGARYGYLRLNERARRGHPPFVLVWPQDGDERAVAGLAVELAARRFEDGLPVVWQPDGAAHGAEDWSERQEIAAGLVLPLRDGTHERLGEIGVLTRRVEGTRSGSAAILRLYASMAESALMRGARGPAEPDGAVGRLAGGGSVLLDVDDRVVEADAGFEETFGYRRGEIAGRRLGDLIVPQALRDEAADLSQRCRGGLVVRRETVRRTSNGRLIPVRVLGLPLRFGPGRVGVLGAYQEIRQHRHDRQALARSEAKYRSLFESSKDVIYISTPEGRLLDMNPAGVELFELRSAEELTRIDIARDLFVRPTDRGRLMEALAEHGFVREFETEMKTRSGRRLVVQDTCSAERDATGRLVAVHGFLRDVTQHRELEQQLRHSQKMEAVGRLAGGVAHDFNNLLMGIEGYAAVLLAQLDSGSSLREDVEEIRRLGRLGGQLTRKLLAFSRQQPQSLEVLDPNAVVRHVDAWLGRVLGEDIERETRLAADVWTVRADAAQLEQVLVNLAVNARDAMPHGGRLVVETANVALTEEGARAHLGGVPGDFVCLTVSDTGEGMSADTRERIFEPFFTTKEVGKGSGLGLSIVYGIVQQSGGFIGVESEPGRGTRFSVYVPRHRAQEAERAPAADLGLAGVGHGMVLLVEDDRAVRTALRRLLEGRGYRLLTASDGPAAIELSASHRGPIDVLLTDLVLPGMSGHELVRRLRLRRPGLKVLLMSGHAAHEEMAAEAAANADAPLLQKPFKPETLLRQLRRMTNPEAES
jgi:PAS domain S-box-containing protein